MVINRLLIVNDIYSQTMGWTIFLKKTVQKMQVVEDGSIY